MGKKVQGKRDHRKDHRAEPGPRRPRTEEEFNDTIRVPTSDIKNKQKRLEVRGKRRATLKNIKASARKKRKTLPAEERQMPKSIEDKQAATDAHLVDEHPEHEVDEFQPLLSQEKPIKLMLTTSYRPTKRLYNFMKELMIMFPNSYYYPRQKYRLQDVYQYAKNLNYSHVLILRDAGRWELMVRTIDGGLAVFKLTSIMLGKDIYHHGLATDHNPELILNNFNSKVGIKVGRLFASLFPQNPEFKGRRVVTFHLQRDFIFVRQHRYIFGEDLDKVDMQEIGPRFTLQLRTMYEADEDGKVGDLQFNVEDKMYVDRKSLYL